MDDPAAPVIELAVDSLAVDGVITAARRHDGVAVEAPLEIRLGGRGATVLMRTPGHDEELVRGFLYSEGLIGELGDILSLGRPEHLVGDEVGNVIDVALRPDAGGGASLDRTFYGSSSCGVCGKNTISQLAVRSPVVSSSLRIEPRLLATLPERLRAAQPAFLRTGGLHACGLFDASGELVAVREDVGRHNALDKLIGWAAKQGALPAHDRVLLVSGRASYEIVQKAIAAGVPVVAAIGAPSSLAVRLASDFDVTLVGFLRADRLNVYAGAGRLG
jgi:FdhD protein